MSKILIRRTISGILNQLWDVAILVACMGKPKEDLVMVTGSDSSHYQSLIQLLISLLQHEPEIVIVVYDLGLLEQERHELKKRFPTVHVRRFAYGRYPNHLNIQVNAGEYAWKPVIIHETLNEFKAIVCWMDAGNVVHEPLTEIRRIVRVFGVYSPRSDGTVYEWTHPKTLEYLGISENDPILDKHNLNGACVAFQYSSGLGRSISKRWNDCALDRNCIAPEGSSRMNHRQDQAVLSVISRQMGVSRFMPKKYFGFRSHQDIDPRSLESAS